MAKKKFVGSKEAAEMMGVHVQTIREWFHEGRLPGVYGPYRRLLFDVKDIHTLDHERKKESQTWIGPGALAKLLNISRWTLEGHIASGRIPYKRNEIGYRRFRTDMISEWAESLESWEEVWYTSKQAARFLGLKHAQLLELVYKKVLPARSLERGYPRFMKSELHEWYENLGMQEFDASDLSEAGHRNLSTFNKWMSSRGYASSTINRYVSQVRQFLSWYSHSYEPLIEEGVITSNMLERYEAFLMKRHKSKAAVLRPIIGLRHYFTWAVAEGVVINSPFNPLDTPPDLTGFENWLVDRGIKWSTVKSTSGNLRSFAKWLHEARGCALSPSLATPQNFQFFWAHSRIVKKLSINSKSPYRTALKRYTQFGVDINEIDEDPWRLMTPAEKDLERRYLSWLRREYSSDTAHQRINAFQAMVEWHNDDRGEPLNPASLSIHDLNDFKDYLEEDRGLSIHTRKTYLNGARILLGWAGKLKVERQFLKLGRTLRRRLRYRLSRLSEENDQKEILKIRTLLYLNKGASLNKASKKFGPARVTICKWIMDLESKEPELVDHQVIRPSLKK